MTTDTLLAGSDEPAHLPGHGPLVAPLARQLATPGNGAAAVAEPAPGQPHDTAPGEPDRAPAQPDHTAGEPDHAAPGKPRGTVPVFVRRLLTDPIDHTVTVLDTGRRRFDGALARLIDTRDQHCRMPYCTAPIRHHDHIHPHRHGGPTTAANGQGLCERASYVKEMPGWRSEPNPDPGTASPSPPPPDTRTPHTHHQRSAPDQPAPVARRHKDNSTNHPALFPTSCLRSVPSPGYGRDHVRSALGVAVDVA